MVQDLHTEGVTVKLVCDTVGVSKSGYYAWTNRPASERSKENAALLIRIHAIHEKSKQTYGSPRMTVELQSEGLLCSENRIARIMRENQIASEAVRKFKITTTDSNHDLPIADRIFETEHAAAVMAPNQVWAGDITFSTPSRSGPAGCRKERTSMNGMRVSTKGVYRHSTALCYERA